MAFPKFSGSLQRAWITVTLHPQDCCLHSLLSQKGCLPCNYSLLKNCHAQIYLFYLCVVLPIFLSHHVRSWRDHLCLVKQHISLELFLSPYMRKMQWLWFQEPICLCQEQGITNNLHFKNRCRVVKETNWRKGKKMKENWREAVLYLGSGGQRRGDSREGTEVVFVW